MKKFLFFLLLSSSVIFAQDKTNVDLSNPNSTVYTHFHFLQPDSYEPAKSALTIYGYEGEKAEEIAIKIKKILDGKGLRLDFNKIPNNSQYADSTGYKAENKYVLFPYQMPEIYIEKIGASWYFSRETISNLDELYNSIFPWFSDKLQDLVPAFGHKKFLSVELWQYLGLIILIILCFILFWIFKKIVYFILKKIQLWIVHRSNEKINTALRKLTRPIVLLIIIWLIERALPTLFLNFELNAFLFLALNIMSTVFWIYVFLKLVEVAMTIYGEFAKKTHSKLDDQLVPVLNNFLTGIVVFLGFLKLLTLFGIEPTAVIAGASIGGLALAFASQDTVKNLIGTIMIFMDKPFHIDDWIEAGEVVGTVESVGFRSSRIRAADTSVYQIPNSKLSEIVVNNKGLRKYRRYNTNLGLRYDTPPDLIDAFVKGVRKLIENHPDTHDHNFNVEFTGFGDSALLILVNMYFTDLAWAKEQSSKHSLHIEILKIAEKFGVEFAFPSTTVMIEQFPDKKSLAIKYDVNKKRLDGIIDEI